MKKILFKVEGGQISGLDNPLRVASLVGRAAAAAEHNRLVVIGDGRSELESEDFRI